MGNRLEKLLPASWREVPFQVRAESQTDGGRRIIIHDYLNSDRRYIEDMGQIPPNFKITAFVHGEDFLEKADKLEKALNQQGVGKLVMPTFGELNLYALPYQKDATLRDVGEITFELSFASGISISGPVKARPVIQTLHSKTDKALNEIANKVEEKQIPPTNTSNALAAMYDLKQCANALQTVISTVNNVSDIESAIALIQINAPKIVRAGSSMKTSFMTNLWQKVSVGLTGGKGVKKLLDLTKFGADLTLSLSDIKNAYENAVESPGDYAIPLWIGNTATRIARNANRLTVVNAGRLSALVTAYDQTAEATYQTDVELEYARADVETAYSRLMFIDTNDPTLIQSDPEIRTAIDDVRLTALELLAEKEQSVYVLTSLPRQASTTSYVEAYNLYAEDFFTSEDVVNRGIELRALNPTLPSDKLKGDITVLQK